MPRGGASTVAQGAVGLDSLLEHGARSDRGASQQQAEKGRIGAGNKRSSSGGRKGTDSQKRRKVDSTSDRQLLSSVNALLESTDYDVESEIQTIEVIPCTLDEAIAEALGRSVKLEKDWSDRSLAGTPCKVFWSTDNVWYGGRILFLSRDEKSIFVHYDDGMTEWVDIKTESVLLGLGLVVHRVWPAQRFWLSELGQKNFPKMNKGIYIEYIGEKMEHAYVKDSEITNFFAANAGRKIKNFNMAVAEIERKRFIVRSVAEKVSSLILKRLCGEDLVGVRIRVNRDDLMRAISRTSRRAARSNRDSDDVYETAVRSKPRRRQEDNEGGGYDSLPDYLTGVVIAANIGYSKYYIAWDKSCEDQMLPDDVNVKEKHEAFSRAHLPRWLGLHETARNAEVAPSVDGMIDVPAQVYTKFDMPEITPASADESQWITTVVSENELEIPLSDMFNYCGLCRGISSDRCGASKETQDADDAASLSDDSSVLDRDRPNSPAAFISCSKCRQSYHASCMPTLVTPYPIVTGGKEAKRTSKDKRTDDLWMCWFCTECAECRANVWEKPIYNVDLKELISSYDRTFRVYAGAKRECQTNRLLCVGCVDKYSLLKKEYCPICLETYPSDNELKQREAAAGLGVIEDDSNGTDSYLDNYCELNDYKLSNTQKPSSSSFVIPKYLSQNLPVMLRLKSYSDSHAPVERASKRKSAPSVSSKQQRGGTGNIQSPVKKRLNSSHQKSKFGALMQQSSEEYKVSAGTGLDNEIEAASEDKTQSEDTCDGMVECNDCGRWVHAKCEAINEAAFEAIGNCTHPVWGDEYLCPKCRYNAFTTTLNKLEDRDVYNLFAAPVNEALAPGYSELIRYPMDLATMRTKIETGVYKSMQTLRQDFELICANAVKFNKRGDAVWRASVLFFLRGSDVLSKTRVSQLSLYGQEVLKIVTAEEIQQTISKSLSKPQIGDKEKKESDQKAAENKSKQPKTKLAALANERYQPPKWLASWLESELQPKQVKETSTVRTNKSSAVQSQGNVYAKVVTSYRTTSSRRRGEDSPQTTASVGSLFVQEGGPTASVPSVAVAETSALTASRAETNSVDPLIAELSKFPKLVPFAAVTEFVRSTITSVSHEIAHFDCARDVCLVCGSGGASEVSKLIFCCDCGEGYHSYCVFPANAESGRIERIIDGEWRCMNCSRCDECFSDWTQGSESRADEYIYCDHCDKAFHLSCITPKLHVIPEFSWYCKHCVQCSSCAAGVGPDYFGESADGSSAIRRGRVWGKFRNACIACTVGNRSHPNSTFSDVIDVIDTPRSCFECNRSVSNKTSGSDISDLSAPDSACTLHCTFCFRVQHLECYQKFIAKLRKQFADKCSDVRRDFAQAARDYCHELQKNFVCSSCRLVVQKRRGPEPVEASKHQVLHVRQARMFYTILKRMSEGHFRASRFRLKLFESIVFCRTVTMWALSIVREAPQILPFVFKAFVGPTALYARSKVSRVPTWSLQRASRFIDIVRGEYGSRVTPAFEHRQFQMLSKVLHSDWVHFDAALIDETQWRPEDLALLFKICGLAASFMWVMFRLLRYDSSPILKAAYVRWAAPSGPAYKVLSHGLSVKGRALAPTVGDTAIPEEHATLAGQIESKVRLRVNKFEKKPVCSVDDVEAEAKLFRYSNEVCVSNILGLLRRFLEPSRAEIILSPSLGHIEAKTQEPKPYPEPKLAEPTSQNAGNQPGSDGSISSSVAPKDQLSPPNTEATKPLNDFNSCLSDELIAVFFKDKAVRVKLEQFIVSVLMPPAGLGKAITENGIKTRREIVAELRENQTDETTERLTQLSMIDDIVDIDNFYFSNIHSQDSSFNSPDRYFDISTTSWDIYTIMMTGLRGASEDCCAWWFNSYCVNDSSEIRDPMLVEIRNVLALKSSPVFAEKKTPKKRKNKLINGNQGQVADTSAPVVVIEAGAIADGSLVPQGNEGEVPPAISNPPSAVGASEASAETKKRNISKLRDLIEPVTSLVYPDRCHVIVNGEKSDISLKGWETLAGQNGIWEDFRRCAFCNGPDVMPSAKLFKFYNLQVSDTSDCTSSVVKVESDENQQDGVASSADRDLGSVATDNCEAASSVSVKSEDRYFAEEPQVFEVEIPSIEGRLITLPYFSNDMRYAHVNCLRYSTGVHETTTGELRGTAKALSFADVTVCSFCNQLGASIRCDANRCKKVFHLRCGIVSGCFSITGRWKHIPEQNDAESAVAKSPGIISSQEVAVAKDAASNADVKPIVRRKRSQMGSQSRTKKVSLSLPPTDIARDTIPSAGADVAKTAEARLIENFSHGEAELQDDDIVAKEDNGDLIQESVPEVVEVCDQSGAITHIENGPNEQSFESTHCLESEVQEIVKEPASIEDSEGRGSVETMSEHCTESSGRAKREVKPKVVLDAYAGRLPSSRQKRRTAVVKTSPRQGAKAVKRGSAASKVLANKILEGFSTPARDSRELEARTSSDDIQEVGTTSESTRASRYVNQSAELMRKCKEHTGELRVLINCNDHSSYFEKDWVSLMTPPMEPCREITIEPKDWLPAVLAEGSSSIGEKKKFAIARLLKDGRATARIGSLTIHDIGQPVVDSIWFNDAGVIYPPGYCATRLHWSYVRPGQRTLYQIEILSSRNLEHLVTPGDGPIIADTVRSHFPVFRLTALDDPSFVYLSLTIEDCYVWLRNKISNVKDTLACNLQTASVDVIRNLSSKVESRSNPKFGFRAKSSNLTDAAVKLAALRFFGLGLEVVHRAIEMSPESVAAMMPHLFLWGTGYLDETALVNLQKKLDFFSQKIASSESNSVESLRIIASRRDAAYAPSFVLPQKNATAELLRLVSAERKSIVPKITCSRAMSFVGGKLNASEEFEVDGASILNKVADLLQSSRSSSSGASTSTSFSRAMKRATKTDVEEEEPAGLAELLADMPDDGSIPASERLQARLEKDYWVMQRNNSTDMGSFLAASKSAIHGWGLYAQRDFPANSMLIEYIGEEIRHTVADRREAEYERQMGLTGSCYLFRLDKDSVIDATHTGGMARFLNHCCEPNSYAYIISTRTRPSPSGDIEGSPLLCQPVGTPIKEQKHIVIMASRQIKAGEEITYDYKFPIEEDNKLPCLCGALFCRGSMN